MCAKVRDNQEKPAFWRSVASSSSKKEGCRHGASAGATVVVDETMSYFTLGHKFLNALFTPLRLKVKDSHFFSLVVPPSPTQGTDNGWPGNIAE